ncbi:hypothetical protein EG329_004482 [Mollisiaceae sp. DMI_Dod_QoI]|nr:hypothetical protein EG329_004482 [Helotiales sp. DMI_Dod_QoI]
MFQRPLVDPLLVSIDCEFYETDPSKHTIREIGISILDTRYLKSLSQVSSSTSAFQNAISTTYNLTFECAINKVKNPSKFLFTTSARVSKSELKDVLREFTEARNSIKQGKSRDVIIVGHDFAWDLQVLAHENFLVPNVELLDTLKIAREILANRTDGGSTAIDYTLRALLQGFHISHTARNLHNGGNDSHLTLRLLLMLAVESIRGTLHAPLQQSTASVLTAAARSPLRRRVGLEKARSNRNEIVRLLSIPFKVRINAKIRKINKLAKAKSPRSNASSVAASVVPPAQADFSIAVDSPSSLDASGMPLADLESSDKDDLSSAPYST